MAALDNHDHAAPAWLRERRANADRTAAETPLAAGIVRTTTTAGDVPLIILEPDLPGERATILYLHGGGYRSGTALSYTPYAARLAVWSTSASSSSTTAAPRNIRSPRPSRMPLQRTTGSFRAAPGAPRTSSSWATPREVA